MVAMGAEELAAAFHVAAPMRNELSNIWNEALRDDEDDDMEQHTDSSTHENTGMRSTAVSPSSSSTSNSSSPGLPPQTQHHQQQQQQMLMMNQQALLAASSAMLTNPAAFYYPMNAGLHMNDFGAFLASSAPAVAQHQPTPASMLASGNTAPTNAMPAAPLGASFLDDLLSSTDDMDFRVRSGSQSNSNSNNSSTNFVLPQSHSLPPSIQQQLMQSLQMQRQSATSPNGDPMTDSPFLGLDGGTADGGDDRNASGIATRLLQLENNYERKKKRAKINRKDLNARFQDLMDILNLKEDRKLNRAKILEKTIEYIEKLEDELHAIKQVDPKKAPSNTINTNAAAVFNQGQSHQQQAVQMMMQNSTSSHVMATSGGSLMAFDPTGAAHAWTAAAGASMTPMMWLPCSMIAPPNSSALLRGAAPNRPRSAEKKKSVCANKPKPAAAALSDAVSSATVIPVATEPSLVEGTKRSLKRARDTAGDVPVPAATSTMVLSSSTQLQQQQATGDADLSAFVWSAQEIPTLLSFCDAWTLANLMGTSKELGGLARQNRLWVELCRRRWRLGGSGSNGSQLQLPSAREQVRRGTLLRMVLVIYRECG